MIKYLIMMLLIPAGFSIEPVDKKLDYENYHKQVISIEELLASERYEQALEQYESLFQAYDFIFLKEYQIASQLALYQQDKSKMMRFLKEGIRSGWELKSIKKNDFIKSRLNKEDWNLIKQEYVQIRKEYESKLNQDLRERVQKMYSKDQWKALGALFRFSDKGQQKYAEKKFAPHSEKQIDEFNNIISSWGYPGEQLIGNNYWMSTVLSHHNSISTAYNKKDKRYPALKPQLLEALKKGQISPAELALIDDWYRTSKFNRQKASYGFLDRPTKAQLPKTNELRQSIFLRSFELREALMEVEKKTGMNFYLRDRWY